MSEQLYVQATVTEIGKEVEDGLVHITALLVSGMATVVYPASVDALPRIAQMVNFPSSRSEVAKQQGEGAAEACGVHEGARHGRGSRDAGSSPGPACVGRSADPGPQRTLAGSGRRSRTRSPY